MARNHRNSRFEIQPGTQMAKERPKEVRYTASFKLDGKVVIKQETPSAASKIRDIFRSAGDYSEP